MAIVLTEQLSLGFLTVFEIASMGRYPHTNHLGKLKAEDIRIIKEALISSYSGQARFIHFFFMFQYI